MVARVDKVRKTLMKEISDIIRRNVKDARISGIVSVTDIDLSGDLGHAKVFISVYGSDKEKEQTMEALVDNTPIVRKEVGRRIRLRHVPEIEFKFDDSIERGTKVTDLINKISRGEL
ncbi:MAG: 30S ribosome-binding factor RbfA [Candidatus Gastranaerophilales bacterium]|nr:30S ribosome-binding factor RbfA [Candidatus Gastranaerophilales bacterium]